MTDKAEYEELVDKTISEIKEKLESSDKYELEKVLDAEKENKDRKTLKSWLENRIEKKEEEAEEESSEAEKKEKDEKKEEKPSSEMKSVVSDSGKGYDTPWKKPSTNLLLGILIGVAVTALLMYSPSTGTGVPEGITEHEASEMAGEYINQQLGDQQQVNISVDSVDTDKYGDLYVVSLSVSSEQGAQDIDVYVTRKSGLMFLGPLAGAQPIDLSEGTPVGNMVAEGTGAE